jgi:opacity protein-like surface antigen
VHEEALEFRRVRSVPWNRGLIRLILVLVLVLGPAISFAQAWLPPQGEAFISLSYGNIFVTKHYAYNPGGPPSDSTESNRGHIRSRSVTADLGYAITDRFAVSVALPYTEAKWYPAGGVGNPHTLLNGKTLDDGDYHGTFQDYNIEARYQAVRNPVVLTPFVGAVIPSHEYQHFAHSAVGRNLHEYQFGFNLGSNLDRIVPGSYVQARYSYAFVERVLDIHHDRSNGALELGYFVTPSLGARFLASGFYTHGGISNRSPTSLGVPRNASNPLVFHHDQIEHASAISLGGGLSYALTGSVDVYANYLRTVAGHGGHKIDHGLTFGVSYGFSPSQVVRRLFGPRIPVGEPPIQP